MVAITVATAIVVSVIMAPSPVFLLFPWRQLAKFPALIASGLVSPLPIVIALVIIPLVIIGVVGIVYPVIMVAATATSGGYSCQRRNYCPCQQQRTQAMQTTTHFQSPHNEKHARIWLVTLSALQVLINGGGHLRSLRLVAKPYFFFFRNLFNIRGL
jgi:hypothetical protein